MPSATARSPLPLNGSALVLPIPAENTQLSLTLQGELRFAYDGSLLDARHADEPGSLIQIEPGQWTLKTADEAQHAFTFVPAGPPVSGSTSIQLEVSRLVDKYVMSPAEVQSNLSGSLQVTLDAAEPPPPPAASGMLFLAVSVAVALLVGLTLAYRLKQRTPLDQDILEGMAQIRKLSRSLTQVAAGRSDLDPAASRRVPQLAQAAERLSQTVLTLRKKAREAGLQAARATVRRLEAQIDQQPQLAGELSEARRRLELLLPLEASDQALTQKLTELRAGLETLHTAWVVMDAGTAQTDRTKAEETLSSLDSEIQAAVATFAEQQRM